MPHAVVEKARTAAQQQRTVVTGYVTVVHHVLLSAMASAAASSARHKAYRVHIGILGVQAAPETVCIRHGGSRGLVTC